MLIFIEVTWYDASVTLSQLTARCNWKSWIRRPSTHTIANLILHLGEAVTRYLYYMLLLSNAGTPIAIVCDFGLPVSSNCPGELTLFGLSNQCFDIVATPGSDHTDV